MLVQYIKLRRTTEDFSALVGTAIKAGEPIVINHDTEGQYLLLGGDTDSTISADTKVLKPVLKAHADSYVFTEKNSSNYDLKEPGGNTINLTNNTTGQAGKVANVLTVNGGDEGANPGALFDGSAPKTITWKTVGAPKAGASISAMDNTSSNDTPNNLLYVKGSSTPSEADRNKLWIDTTPGSTTSGIKYWNGSAWVHVPVAYT